MTTNDRENPIKEILLAIDRDSFMEGLKTHTDLLFGPSNNLTREETENYSDEFVDLFFSLIQSGKMDFENEEYRSLAHLLENIHRKILLRGGSSELLFRVIRFLQSTLIDIILSQDHDYPRGAMHYIVLLFGQLQIQTFRNYQEDRETAIRTQHEELLALATPITEIWDGVLTLPVIGAMDSARVLHMMEKLLLRIESSRAKIIIIDLTSVSAFETNNVPQLAQVIRATALMGAKSILTGIRSEIARSLAGLDLDFGDTEICATLSEGLKSAFNYLGLAVSRTSDI